MFQKIHDKLNGKYSLGLIKFVYVQMFKISIAVFKLNASSVYLKHLGTFYLNKEELEKRIKKLKRLNMSHEREDQWLETSKNYSFNDRDS